MSPQAGYSINSPAERLSNFRPVTFRLRAVNLATTHRSSRLLTDRLGVGSATVARAWRGYGFRPWRAETFKFSTDPELVTKVPIWSGCA